MKMKNILCVIAVAVMLSISAKESTCVGLVSDGSRDTATIQAKLDACWQAGGGTVTLEPGVYFVGGLRVRSDTTLYLKSGCVLKASRVMSDYVIRDRETLQPFDPEDLIATDMAWTPPWKRKGKKAMHIVRALSNWNNAIIRIYKAENVKIVAEKGAIIDGLNSYDAEGEEDYRGAHGISAHKSRNLEFRGYTIRNTGNWAHNVKDCQDIVFADLEILGGHDGVHLSSCDRVDITNCVMKTGDDCMAGFDNRDVHVSGCTFNTACSAFRVGGTRFLVEKCRCYGPAEYPFRGSLSKVAKEQGLVPDVGKRNMLAFFTYYADKTLDIREQPEAMTFRDITVENADRFMHYNFSGNEVWQLGMPLKSVSFENVTATGVKLPLCAYGEEACPIALAFKNVKVVFATPVHEFIRGAHVREIREEELVTEGVEGPRFRDYAGRTFSVEAF